MGGFVSYNDEYVYKHTNCYHCAGFYGPCFGEPLCATCHEFLCPADPFTRERPLQLCDQKADECDSGNEEPRDSQQECGVQPRVVRLDGDRVFYQYPAVSPNSPTSPCNQFQGSFSAGTSDCFPPSSYAGDKFSLAYSPAPATSYTSGPPSQSDYANCSASTSSGVTATASGNGAPVTASTGTLQPLSASATGTSRSGSYYLAPRDSAPSSSSSFQPKEASSCFSVHRENDSVDESSSSDSDDENAKRLFYMVTSKVKALCSVPGADRYPKLQELEKSFSSILGKSFEEDIQKSNPMYLDEILRKNDNENDPMAAAQRRLIIEQLTADRSDEGDYQDPIEEMVNELASCDPSKLCYKPNGKVRTLRRKKKRSKHVKYLPVATNKSWQGSSGAGGNNNNNNNNAYAGDVSNNSCRCSATQSSCVLQERLCLLTNHQRYTESEPSPLVNRIPPEVWLLVFRKMDDVSLWQASRVCTSWSEIIFRNWGHDSWRRFTLLRWRFFRPLYTPKHWHATYTSLMEASPCKSCQSALFEPVGASLLAEQRSWRMTRLRTELRNLLSDSPEGIEATPLDIQALHWQASIRGPDDSPYQGGTFFLHILIPPRYPLGPPVVRFLTKIFHPNVSCHGDIGIDSIQHNWSLALTISKVLISIQSLLTDPYTKVCMDPRAGALYDFDRVKFDVIAREWTWRYAMVDTLQPRPSTAELMLCAAASDSFDDNSVEDMSSLLQDPGEDDNNDQEQDNNDQEPDNNEPDNNDQEQENNEQEQNDPGQDNEPDNVDLRLE
ncbi:Ubiquitin-conjugating enzyme E2 [Trinorchestia longiramus]|nr:Ubiquitin-conjugating enzyme E2 [Trinorchestia longiramus]